MLLNKERALKKMAEFKMDALIAAYPENVSYLSDLQSHIPYMYRHLFMESFALLPRRADVSPALIVGTVDASWPARFPTWIQETYTFGNPYYDRDPEGKPMEGEANFMKMMDDRQKWAPSAAEVIIKALKDRGLDKGTIGFDEKGFYPWTREAVIKGLPQAKIVDAFELIRVIRMVKTPEELERITNVGVRNERAAQSVLNKLAPGVSEEELTQHFLECLAKEGAVFEFWNTASGSQCSMHIMAYGHYHPPSGSGYRLKKGDMFRYDGGSIIARYHSDAGGCAVLGTPTQKQKTYYRAIEAGMERAMELLRPGALPSKIFEESSKAVEKAGIKEYSKYATFCGHGIGIEARDYPIFTKPVKATSPYLPGSYDCPIEEGMVISIEVHHSVMGIGGFQVEYTLLVKKDGCEKLYPHTRELVVR
jgi:Xaa-Pro aminopeptidase